MNKLADFPELNRVILRLLFQGQGIAYNADDAAVQNKQMFCFVKVKNSLVLPANRLFEMRLYNKFLLDFKEHGRYRQKILYAFSTPYHKWHRQLLCGSRDKKPDNDEQKRM